MNNQTTVVHCKRDSYDVYIGRGSQWQNPYIVGKDGSRSETIAKHAAWIVQRPDLMRDLHDLKGRRLGCYCFPKPCHGDTLARLADALPEPIQQLALWELET